MNTHNQIIQQNKHKKTKKQNYITQLPQQETNAVMTNKQLG